MGIANYKYYRRPKLCKICNFVKNVLLYTYVFVENTFILLIDKKGGDKMCSIMKYSEFYSQVEFYLREYNIPKENSPGYELLRRGIVIEKVYDHPSEELFMKKLKADGIIIPVNRYLKKDRDDAIQWMIEALEVAEIIPLNHEDDVENILFGFIKKIADRL